MEISAQEYDHDRGDLKLHCDVKQENQIILLLCPSCEI